MLKRLRKSKKQNSENIAKLSGIMKDVVSNAVRKQQIETMKLPKEVDEISRNITFWGYSIIKAEYEMNQYYEIVSGNYEPGKEKTEICSFVKELYERAFPFLSKKGIKQSVVLPQEKIFAEIDIEKFSYAFFGLLLNAAEAVQAKGSVKIKVSSTKKFVKIAITDNGVGMNEETLLHCKEPFFSNKTEKDRKRIGLGLTIAGFCIEASGGRLGVSSKPEKGTTVSVLLPFAEKSEGGLAVENIAAKFFDEKLLPEQVVFFGIEEE